MEAGAEWKDKEPTGEVEDSQNEEGESSKKGYTDEYIQQAHNANFGSQGPFTYAQCVP